MGWFIFGFVMGWAFGWVVAEKPEWARNATDSAKKAWRGYVG